MLISIIITNYNSEQYIKRCINSLLCQLDNETELIIIDDCSTDNGVEVLSKLIKGRNQKIKLICNQTNLGVAETRNIGIKSANGDYVIFIDSDDYVTDNYVSILTNSIKESYSDIILFDFKLCSSNGIKIIKTPELPSKEAYISALLKSAIHNSLCNKLIRRDLIVKNHLYMCSSINMFEDKSLCYRIFYYAEKITNTKKCIYIYDRTHVNSISRLNPSLHIGPALILLDGIDDFFSNKSIPSIVNDAIVFNKIMICGLIALYGSKDIRLNEQLRFKSIPFRYFFKCRKAPFHYRLSALFYRYNMTLLSTILDYIINFFK